MVPRCVLSNIQETNNPYIIQIVSEDKEKKKAPQLILQGKDNL